MSIKLIESFTFKLVGDTVRVTTTSGGKVKESAVPIATFIQSNLQGREIIALWQARQGALVPIAEAKRKR